MKNRNQFKSIIISRSLLLAFSFVGLVWGYVNSILLNNMTRPAGIDPTTSGQFFMYFTIWSNIFCFLWATIAFTSVITENEKIESFVNHWAVKSTPVMWIGVTFLILNFVLMPEFISVYGIGPAMTFYVGLSVFQHILTPVFMINDFRLTKGFDKKEKYSTKEIIKNSLLALIPGILWISLSIILLWKGLITPQYFFMKFFHVSTKTKIINSVTVAAVAILFIFLNVGLFYYHNRNISKNNINNKIKAKV